MIEIPERALPQDKARTLLRRLRDLNLTAGPIAVSAGAHVILSGCVSGDAPAECGVRYRLQLADGSEGLLEIRGNPGGLEIGLTQMGLTGAGAAAISRRLIAGVTCDRAGRACSRALAARVTPETRDTRELEHFLRRIVRVILKA